MATATKPEKPASAPKDATQTSVWKKLFGGGATDAAAEALRKRKEQTDAAAGYKNGGMVKAGKSSTPYKCK